MKNVRQSTLYTKQRGFTLIELMVSTTLFAVVMLVSVSSLLALANANRKAQALQSVMNNLNVAIDGMVRSVRMGTSYHCGEGVYATPAPCPGGNATFAFERFGGSPSSPGDQWIYWFEDGRIYKSESGSKANLFAITAPDVEIDDVQFHVVGTTPGDTTQPKVLITIRGTASAQNVPVSSSFVIQATAVQRLLDI